MRLSPLRLPRPAARVRTRSQTAASGHVATYNYICSSGGGVYHAATGTKVAKRSPWHHSLPPFQWQDVHSHCAYSARLGTRSEVRDEGTHWAGCPLGTSWGDNQTLIWDASRQQYAQVSAYSSASDDKPRLRSMPEVPPPGAPPMPDPWSISADEVDRRLPKHYGHFHSSDFASYIETGMRAEIQKMCMWPIFGLPQACPHGFKPIGTMWVIKAKA